MPDHAARRLARSLVLSLCAAACAGPRAAPPAPLPGADRGADCGACHAAAVRAPSGAVSRHAPFERAASSGGHGCATCHGPHDSPYPSNLLSPAAPLCFGCHAELRARIDAPGALRHPPVLRGGCLDCHRGHASAEPRLLRLSPPALCFRCHSEEAEETFHQGHLGRSIAAAWCPSCHDPHASQRKALLR